MTWYWWTHWFWITSVLGLLNGHPLAGLDPTATVKMRPGPINRPLSTRGEPLHFPIAVQSDEDDIFDGHSGSITIDDTRLNDEWLQPERPLLKPQITSTRTSSTIAHLVVASSVAPETTPVYTDQHIITARLNTRSNEIGSSTTPRLSGPATSNGTSTQAVPQTNTSSKRPQSSFPPRDAVAPNLIAINATASSHPNATSDHQPPSSPAEDERHNYTNELLVPGAKSADASAEKPQRQSKNLSSAPRATAVLDASSEDNFTAETKNLLTAMSAAVSVSADDVVSERDTDGGPSAGSLNAGAISGICVAVLTGCGVFGAAGVLAYRRRYVNKPQTLSEPDSSGYIDDSTIRENSDEMYSLDNDSFLNSLEAMTIQNYWTENVKHTKL